MRTMLIPTFLILFCSLTQLTNAVGQSYDKGCGYIDTCFAPEECALPLDNEDCNSKKVLATTSINHNCPGLFRVHAYTKYWAQVSIVSSLQETTSIMFHQIVPICQEEDKITDFSRTQNGTKFDAEVKGTPKNTCDVSSFEFNNEVISDKNFAKISFTPNRYHCEDAIKAAGAFAILILLAIRRSSRFLVGCSIVLAGLPVSEGRPLHGRRPPASSLLELPFFAAMTGIICGIFLTLVVARNGLKTPRRVLSSLHHLIATLCEARDNLLSIAFNNAEASYLWRHAISKLIPETVVKYRCSALLLLVHQQYTVDEPSHDRATWIDTNTMCAEACYETLARFRRSGFHFTACSTAEPEHLGATGRWAEAEILLAMRILKDQMEGIDEVWRPFLENNDDVIAVIIEACDTRVGKKMLKCIVRECSDNYTQRQLLAYPAEMESVFLGIGGDDGFYDYFERDFIVDFFLRSDRILDRVLKEVHAEHGNGGVNGTTATIHSTFLLEYGIQHYGIHPALLDRALAIGLHGAARLLSTATFPDWSHEEADAAEVFAALLSLRPEFKRWYRAATAAGKESSACAQLGRSIRERPPGTWYCMEEDAEDL